MGMPTRLHGDAVLQSTSVKAMCPKCTSIREWEIVEEKGKKFKKCVKCGTLVEIKDPKPAISIPKGDDNDKKGKEDKK